MGGVVNIRYMIIASFGLAGIIAGWFIQLYHTWKGVREIQPLFVMAYMLGVLLLAIDSYMLGLTELAMLNLGCMVAASLVLVKSRG